MIKRRGLYLSVGPRTVLLTLQRAPFRMSITSWRNNKWRAPYLELTVWGPMNG